MFLSHDIAQIFFSDVYQKFRKNGHAELTIEQVKHLKESSLNLANELQILL